MPRATARGRGNTARGSGNTASAASARPAEPGAQSTGGRQRGRKREAGVVLEPAEASGSGKGTEERAEIRGGEEFGQVSPGTGLVLKAEAAGEAERQPRSTRQKRLKKGKREEEEAHEREEEEEQAKEDHGKGIREPGQGQGKDGAPVIVFAHGAGAGKDSPWMLKWRQLLESSSGACAVVAFDYPYLSGGKRGAPPKAEKLVQFHLEQVEAARRRHPGHPIVLCGKSMGSRVGAMVAAHAEADVKAVICLGYPLRGVNGKSRADTLRDVPCQLLLIQGSKDPMGPLGELQSTVKTMKPGLCELVVVEGGDHSLNVSARMLKEQHRTQQDVDAACLTSIRTFIESLH